MGVQLHGLKLNLKFNLLALKNLMLSEARLLEGDCTREMLTYTMDSPTEFTVVRALEQVKLGLVGKRQVPGE